MLISDMKWPCENGFHIPLNTERQAIAAALTSLGLSWGENFSKYLKIPLAGVRSNANSNVSWQWEMWLLISASAQSNDNAYCVELSSLAVDAESYAPKATWFSLRAKKDTPVAPTRLREALYEWDNFSGIYWSEALGLISISADWINWITISDKNLWATEDWSEWDTLSEANCWWYFQRWNNHWFAWTWNVENTFTKTDASTYWPLNYYSWETFIKSTWDWSLTPNSNLRWWVSQQTHEDLPILDIDQLRRQFPEEVVRYFDAIVEQKFGEVDGRMNIIEDTLDDYETELPAIAQAAADQAEQDFINSALADLATALQPYVAAQVATEVWTQVTDEIQRWVFNKRTGARYKFYIDTAENINALTERENKVIYIWTDEAIDESDEEPEE